MTQPDGSAQVNRPPLSPPGVKDASRRRIDFGKHLDGWQPALVILVLAGLSAVLITPRPAIPDTIPLPRIDRSLQRHLRARMNELANAAVSEPLPYEVRAVGEAVRQVGTATATGDAAQFADVAEKMQPLVVLALKTHGPEPLRRLRAVQTRLFLQAIEWWEATGEVPTDLRELGGDFPEQARARGWLQSPHRLALDPADLPSVFQVRWTALTGLLRHPEFAPTREEWKAHYRAQLAFDPLGRDGVDTQLKAARALAEHDSEYPVDLALGILNLKAGRPQEAEARLSEHLNRNPSGRWFLRARSYLAAALTASGKL